MTVDGTSGAILFAAIPVTAMLVIEVVLPYWKNRRHDAPSHRSGVDATARRDEEVAHGASVPSDAAGHRVDGERLTRRWRLDGHYYRVLHQSAHTGNLVSMNKLGELALIRKDLVEAFYWKLMVDLHHGRTSGLSARGVCHAWQDAGCPEPNREEDSLFTESQAKLSMAVLDLWSGRHVQTPTEAIRQMMEEGNEDALLYVGHFGIGELVS